MPADPLTSDGARRERKAWRDKIARLQNEWDGAGNGGVATILAQLEEFGKKRKSRYDAATGGLGKK